MIADVVHTSLNARGGAERLAVVTVKALRAMGFKVQLATNDNPNLNLIQEAFGEGIVECLTNTGKQDLSEKNDGEPPTITINTHGDMLAFFREYLNPRNSLVYCHYPLARMMNKNEWLHSEIIPDLVLPNRSIENIEPFMSDEGRSYSSMMRNSTVLTNSEFSRRAIFKQFGVESTVLPPPVEVETFRGACLSSCVREDSVLVVSRFHPSKKLENAIHLAEKLRKHAICRYVKIVGNMSHSCAAYFDYLSNLRRKLDLGNFVTFEVNINITRLLDLMRKAKVYFHPMQGEPFGISTVEAISAGLIPVVPYVGGHAEFVPPKYQFRTLDHAAEAVENGLRASAWQRIQLSDSMQKYSSDNYVIAFQQIVAKILGMEPIIENLPVLFGPKGSLGRNRIPSK